MVGCGLGCPGDRVPGCRGASLGDCGEGGTVGARIRGLGVSGWGGVWGTHTIYIYIQYIIIQYIYIYVPIINEQIPIMQVPKVPNDN